MSDRGGQGRLHVVGRMFSTTDHPPLAAALMVFALALLGLQDAIIKLTASDLSIWQFQFIRAMLNLMLLFGGVMLFGGLRTLPPKRGWVVILRSLCLVGAMLCFFSGIPFLSLAEIAAGLYLFPLIVTLLSRYVLGERVGVQRLSAVATGFCGSLLILKPGGEDFQLVSLLPVGAAMFYACMVLITRKMCREESPLTLSSGVAIGFMAAGAIGLMVMPAPEVASEGALAWPYLMTGWHDIGHITLLAIAACSVLNLCANICLARAYQTAESSWLAPYDYSYLVFAALWGFVIWGTVPDLSTIVGMMLIAGAGIFVALRERHRAWAAAE